MRQGRYRAHTHWPLVKDADAWALPYWLTQAQCCCLHGAGRLWGLGTLSSPSRPWACLWWEVKVRVGGGGSVFVGLAEDRNV